MTQLKPLGSALGWVIRQSSSVYECPWFIVREFEVLRGASVAKYAYLDHPGSVIVVPITGNGDIVMLRCYRFTLDQWSWEVPAGTLADREGSLPEAVAAEELHEEIGAISESIEPMGAFFMTNGSAHHTAHFYLARDVKVVSQGAPDSFEDIDQVKVMSPSEVMTCIQTGVITDGDSVLALLLAITRLRVASYANRAPESEVSS